MSTRNIDVHNLKITGAHEVLGSDPHVTLRNGDDGVQIIVTQAFGPTGENLVGISDVTFDGYPAVTLRVRANGQEGLVHLSPFHGDRRKAGFVDIPVGTKCELFCPVSGKPLDRVGKVDESSNAEFYALYLTPRLSDGEMVMLSDVWGDYNSRIIDNFELISMWAAHEDAGA